MFHWTRRMPYWRTWSFLAKQIFLTKTHQKIWSSIFFVVKFHQKLPLVTWILSLTPLLKTSATNPDFLHSKSEKNVKPNFFRKKTHLSQSFLWTYGMRCWQLRLKCLGRKPAIFHSLPISQNDLVSAKFFPRNAPLRWTRRKTSWFVQFLFEVFADAKVADLTPLMCPFSKNMEVFR